MERNIIIVTGYALPPYADTGGGFTAANQFPLSFKANGLSEFIFPLDPFISVSLKNIITRRTISKGNKRGTVKERWTEDDAEITISGTFQSTDGSYPKEVEQLRNYFNKHEAIDVACTLLNEKDILKIAIESLDFPHTKGADTQQFEIKAYSDDVFQLLIEN